MLKIIRSLGNLGRSRLARLLISLAVTGLSLYLILRSVSLAEIGAALGRTRFEFVLLALASITTNNLAKAARWRVLLGARGRQVPYSRVLLAHLGGQMINSIYPVRLGELSRAYVVGGSGAGSVFVLGTIALEKLVDILAYAGLFLLLLGILPLPVWVDDSGYTVAGVAAVAVLVVLVVTWQRARVKTLLQQAGRRFAGRKLPAFFAALISGMDSLDVLDSRWALVQLAIWSVWIWITSVLTNYLALLALGLHLPVSAALLLLVGLIAGINLPSVPGQFGVYEYICILALGVFRVEQSVALSFGILLHAIVLFSTMFPGLVALGLLGAVFPPKARPAEVGIEQ